MRAMLPALLLAFCFNVSAEQTIQGAPTEEDYQFFCKNFGQRGTPLRDRCESDMRIRRGVATCTDIDWAHSCSVDGMTDKTNCTITASGSNLFVFVQRGAATFSVTGNDYPGRPLMIRIDSNPAVVFTDDGTTSTQAQQILRQLDAGEVVRTRYVAWPSGIARDSEAPICNLPDVIRVAQARSRGP